MVTVNKNAIIPNVDSSGKRTLRVRKFFFTCYLDEEQVHDAIVTMSPIKWAYILHDSDVEKETGELKKAHFHVYMEFENDRSFSKIAEVFHLAENNIQKARSTRGSIRYLIHADDVDKYQYSYSDIVTNFAIDVFFKLEREGIRVAELVDLIYSLDKHTSIGDMVKLIAERGLYDVFRRSSYVYMRMYEEHVRA